MSHLLARIMLALLMLPLAAVVYVLTLVLLVDSSFGNDEIAFGLATLLSAAFVGLYWVLLWRRTVRWTRTRVMLSGGAVAFAALVGFVIGVIGAAMIEDSFGIFIGGLSAVLLWLTMTVFVWRETRGERANRLRTTAGGHGVTCPCCGYNLTGLKQTVCPECGTSYTVDELLRNQPRIEQEELA